MDRFSEQLARLRRSYKRLKDINNGRTHSEASDHYTDDMYAFFMNCHHMKDWLINDVAFPASSRDVEDYVNQNRPLRLAADICNAHKHLSLNQGSRSSEYPTLGQRVNQLFLGGDTHVIKVKFAIDTQSGPVDAFDLATECLQLWEQFIASYSGT